MKRIEKKRETKKTEKIIVLAILERNLSTQIPMKKQLAEIAGNVAAKLETDAVRVIKM